MNTSVRDRTERDCYPPTTRSLVEVPNIAKTAKIRDGPRCIQTITAVTELIVLPLSVASASALSSELYFLRLHLFQPNQLAASSYQNTSSLSLGNETPIGDCLTIRSTSLNGTDASR